MKEDESVHSSLCIADRYPRKSQSEFLHLECTHLIQTPLLSLNELLIFGALHASLFSGNFTDMYFAILLKLEIIVHFMSCYQCMETQK